MPSSAWAGSVAPMRVRKSATAFSFSRMMGTHGPDDMKSTSSP